MEETDTNSRANTTTTTSSGVIDGATAKSLASYPQWCSLFIGVWHLTRGACRCCLFLRRDPIAAGPPQGHLTVPGAGGDPALHTPKPKPKAASKAGSKMPKAKTAQQEATKVPRIYWYTIQVYVKKLLSYVFTAPFLLNIKYFPSGSNGSEFEEKYLIIMGKDRQNTYTVVSDI